MNGGAQPEAGLRVGEDVGSRAGRPPRGARRRRGVPLSLVVVGGVIGLLVVAMGLVIALTFTAGLRNTTDLLVFSSQFLVQALENRLESELAPAARLAQRAAAAAAGRAGAATASPAEVVAGAMAVLPQVAGVVLERHLLGAEPSERLLVLPDGRTVPPESRLLVLLRDLAGRSLGPDEAGRAVWGAPVRVDALEATLLPVAAALPRADGGTAAALVLVSMAALGADLAEVRPRGGRSFILYGRDHLIGAAGPQPAASGDSLASVPLPRMAEMRDPVFRAIAAGRGEPLFAGRETEGFDGLFLNLADEDDGPDLSGMLGMSSDRYVVLTRQLAGLTPRPLTVGIYFREEEVSGELDRLWRAGMAALAVLAVAALLAYLLSILITRPVRQFAANARRVAELRLDAVRLGGMPTIREFRDAGDAFGRMLNALRWFESYVPKTLVQELIDHPELDGGRSQERVVTVMFTDIRGFTALAERMPAASAAALLNAHFELVIDCVEAEDGTVDKYIGDCVMCFWGAPRPQADQAARALRAAQAIRAAQAAENARRVAAGEPPLQLRVGVHTGRAIVGNIGSRRRVNYTVIGDMVNIASRLEALGKTLAPDAAFCILASDAVLGHCGGGFAFLPQGAHALRGREGEIGVYALL